MAAFDLNNLPDTDTLHCPTGAIQEAERLLADAYGTDRSFMLVGGSTSGNIAAVAATVGPGSACLFSVRAQVGHCWDRSYGRASRVDNARV